MTESLFSPCFLWWLKLEWWVLDQTYHYQEQGCTTTMQCNIWYSISKLYCVDCSCYSSYLISMSRQHNDGGHNRWHEKIVCCLDMLISRPYIKWRVWSTPDTQIHIMVWEQWPQHQMYRHFFGLDTLWALSSEFNVVLTGLNSKYLCTRRKWLTVNAEKLCLLIPRYAQCSVFGSN